MFGGLNRLLVGATVVGVMLAAPSAALACNNGVSAVNVYKECLPTGGGGKPTSNNSAPAKTTSNPTPAVTVPSRTAKAIKHTRKKDRRVLSSLIKGFGPRPLQTSETASTTAPSAIGSAFDLGSGPTALLVVLAGTAILLLAATGVRGARHRRG